MLLVDNFTGQEIKPKTLFSYKRENNILIFAFEAYESSLNSYSNINNDKLYNGDVVEIFLDLGDEFYYEFEVAPNGATFIATILNREITFIKNDFFKSEVEISKDNYKVIMRIDLSKLTYKEEIKINAFRIETKGIKPNYILEELSPTFTDTFHVRDKFIKI